MSEQIWTIILASGYSRRMGRPKLLLPIRREESMIRRVAALALGTTTNTAVVGRPDDEELRSQLSDLEIEYVANDKAAEGLSASVRAGVAFAKDRGAQAVMMLLGDMPGIEAEVLSGVRDVYRDTGSRIVQVQYADRPGHPVLFDSSLFQELLELTGDQGAKPVLERHAGEIRRLVVSAALPADLDTPEDYEHYLRSQR